MPAIRANQGAQNCAPSNHLGGTAIRANPSEPFVQVWVLTMYRRRQLLQIEGRE